MSSNIITYFLLNHVFFQVLVLVLYDKCFGKYSTRYLFQMLTRQIFFKFCWKLKRPPFYCQNFPDPEFSTALLSFACSRHINKCKYLIFVKLNNISQWKRFSTNFDKNWKRRHFMVNVHRSLNFQLRSHFYGNFQKLVLYC